MHSIEYKSPGSPTFHRYINIGSCEKHPDFLPLFESQTAPYDKWLESLHSETLGVQLLVLHYYLLQYNQQDPLPKELESRFSLHLDPLNRFNQKWFDPDYPHFKGLDLNWEHGEASILSTKEVADSSMEEVELQDGTRIRYNPEEGDIESFFVREEEFEGLVAEWGEIFKLVVVNV